MIFDKTTILGSSTEYEYFGANLYNYRKIKTLKVEGFLIDADILEGSSTPNVQAIDDFLEVPTMEVVTINGEDFGTGKLTSISFSDDDLSPNLKKVSASIEIYEEGLEDDFIVPTSTKFLENLSESFSFNRSASNKDFNYSVSILYLDDETTDPLASAKNLAEDLIDAALSGELIVGYDPSAYKLYSTESIDQISRSYSLSHQYNFVEAPENDCDYTLETSISIDGNGITTVSERGVVRGINGEDLLDVAKSKASTLINDSYDRCLTAFNVFIDEYDTPQTLNQKKISVTRDINERSSTVTYTVVYSNDISIQAGHSWSYSNEIKKSESFYLISERGQIIGDGKPFSSIENAKTAWDEIKNGIQERVETTFRSNTIDFREIYLSSEDTNYSEIDGTINYNFTYSSEPREGDDKITTKNTLTNSYPVDLKNNFNILRDKQISQELNLATVGKTTLTMELRGEKESSFSNYIGFINSNVSSYTPDEEFLHISAPKISFNPKKNLMTFSVYWNWLREFADIDDI